MARRSIAEAEGQTLRLAHHCDPTRLVLSPQEGFLLSRIDGVTSWKLVRELSGLPSEFVDEHLESWLEEGVLEIVSQDKVLAVRSNVEGRAAKRAATWDASVEISEAEQIRILTFEGNLDRSYHEILGVAEDADAATVKKAYFALAREFHPDRYHSRKIGDFESRLERIFMRVAEAYELLSDPIARREIQEAKEEAKRAATESAAVSPAEAVSLRTAPTARPQYRKLAQLSRAINERKLKAKRFYELGMAAASAENWIDASANLRLALSFAPENEIYHTAFGPIQMKANHLRAERLIKEADTALQYRDHRNALRAYEDAVGLRPHDALLNYKTADLAWALGGESLRLARECAKAAVEIEPQNTEYRLLLGRIYRDAGMAANAKREFEAILKADPKNLEAKAELKGVRSGPGLRS